VEQNVEDDDLRSGIFKFRHHLRVQTPVPWQCQGLSEFIVGGLVDVNQHDLRRRRMAAHKEWEVICGDPQTAAQVELPEGYPPDKTCDADQKRR
jgi:hypothetical protein